jgi:hypothetical protein
MATPRILGLPFDSGVDAQVKIRQKQLSVRNRLNNNTQQQDNLVVFNSSTSFVRLSSAVSVDSAERLKTLKDNLGLNPGDITGYELARNLILWGGVNIAQLPRGIGYDLNSTYGFLSDGAQGLKPLPGITNMTSNYKNNGSLREVTLNIKCFTRKQFEAIEAVYLRLGYTMVVEWGHTDYFLNDGIKSKTTGASILSLLYPGTKSDKIDPNTIQTQLNKNKNNTSYNYDGVLSRVTNFSWELSSDLTYDITLYLISWGDIIDSLKINTSDSAIASRSQARIDAAQNPEISPNLINVVNNKSLSSLNALFYQMFQDLIVKMPNNGVSDTTKEQIEDINQLQDEAAALPQAKQILVGVVNEYSNFLSLNNTPIATERTSEEDDKANIIELGRVLNAITSEINAIIDPDTFRTYTGIYSTIETINGADQYATSRVIAVTTIQSKIKDKYKSSTSVFNTNLESRLELDITPDDLKINL